MVASSTSGSGGNFSGFVPSRLNGGTSAPAAVAASTPGPADGSADASAMALINQNFTNFGLNGNAQVSATDTRTLAQWAWQEHLNGVDDKQIALDLRQTDPWKQAYSGMAKLQAQGIAIKESDYQTKKADDMAVLHAFGVPQQMINDEFLGNLIGNQVSTKELQDRLNDYQTAVNDVSGETKDYLRSQYGTDSGDLLGLWLNPDQGEQLIHQKVQAAQVGVAAHDTGFGGVAGDVALRLAGLGVTQGQAQAGFSKLAGMSQLTQTLGDNTGSVTQQDQIAAEFDKNAAAQKRIADVQAGRVAAFAGGGNLASNQSGVTALRDPNAQY